MVDKFWETVAGEVARRWVALAATAASVFWVAGVAAWGLGHSEGFTRIDTFFGGLDTFTQVALTVGAFALVMGSAYLMDLIAPSALRLLQGDLPVKWGYDRVTKGVKADRERMTLEFDKLEKKGYEHLSAPETRRAAALDRKLHLLPVRDADVRLTRLGNLMSASQVRPLLRFGLDPDVVWPAMWLVLPEVTRAAFQNARASFDSALRVLVWGMFLIVWTIWTPWALAAATMVVVAGYVSLLRRAEAFGEISEAAFALYRFDLDARLGFPTPETPIDDKLTGDEVTKFLWRGQAPSGLRWTVEAAHRATAPLGREGSVAHELERLVQLNQRGALSEEEFVAAKQKLFG